MPKLKRSDIVIGVDDGNWMQLKQLEDDGLISRQVFGEKPPIKVIYSLTDFGRSFIPVLDAVLWWGNQIALQKGEFVGLSV